MTETRERQGRQEEVAQQRRRRDSEGFAVPNKMAIPEEVHARLAAEGRRARWANDEGNRLHDLTVNDDYDRVEGVEPKLVGTTKDGKPLKAYLVSKRVDFIEEDKAKAEERRRETERSLVQGRLPTSPGGPSVPVQGQMGAETYVPSSNAIGRGNKIIE